jgi:hypothetical protein
MAGVGASMGAMQSLLERGRRGKGKRRQGRGVGGRHGEREGLPSGGAARSNSLLVAALRVF